MRVGEVWPRWRTHSAVVLAKARTHYPRDLFGEEQSYNQRAHLQDHAVWVLDRARYLTALRAARRSLVQDDRFISLALSSSPACAIRPRTRQTPRARVGAGDGWGNIKTGPETARTSRRAR